MGCKNCALCADHYYNTVAIHRSFHAFSNQSKHKLQAYSKSVTLIDNILTNKIVVKITRSNILCDILDYYSSTVFLILFFFINAQLKKLSKHELLLFLYKCLFKKFSKP